MFEEGMGGSGIGYVVGTKAMVDVPITRMDVAREMGVEEMVTAGAPGVSIMLFWITTLAPGEGRSRVCPTTTTVDGEEAGTYVASVGLIS